MGIGSSSAISENSIVFFEGGHDHDGISSSLVDGEKYSIYDFTVGLSGSSGRQARQRANFNNLKTVISNVVINDVLGPSGVRLLPNSVQSVHIKAGSITATELSANIILVNNIIKSNNYVSGSSGWIINGNGVAEFGDASIRGTIDIGGNDATSFHVNSGGDMFLGATTFATAPFKVSSTGSISAVSGTIAGFDFASGTNLIHTGGEFLGTLSLGLIAGDGVTSNSRVGLDVQGPQPPGKTLEALYDYLRIYTQSTGSGVELTPEGDITATGTIAADEIVSNDLTVVNIISGSIDGNAAFSDQATTALNADKLDSFFADSNDSSFTVPVRGSDASIRAGYLVMLGGATIGASTGEAVRKRNDGYLLTVASRREIKNSIEGISSDFAYSIINALQPVSFRFNEQQYIGDLFSEREAEYREYGFIAQDVAEVNSNLVSYSVNAEGDGVQPSMWSDFALISLSVSAIKGLISELNELKSKVSELESYLFNGPNNEV